MPSWCAWVLFVVFAVRNQLISAEVEVEVKRGTTALLLALQDGPAGAEHLQEWVKFVQSSTAELPPVWVVCVKNSRNAALIHLAPKFHWFMVDDNTSWEAALKNFVIQTKPATVFGLLSEGVLPPVDLAQSITYVEQALAGSSVPTAVTSRSRTKSHADTTPQWLPDTFVAQIWCNSLVMTQFGLGTETVNASALSAILPKLVSPHQTEANAGTPVLVDGTHLVSSVFGSTGSGRPLNPVFDAVGVDHQSIPASDAEGAQGEKMRIGMLELALLRSENGTVSIGKAPWPPLYVLEHVATEDRIVIVNSVNCGYLDFAINFLRSARSVIDGVKVLWVATDDVAFDFMDAMVPGCAVMFLPPNSTRHHAIQAGVFGDDTFKSQVLIRPGILLHIVNQGYTVLWTDSDMVWVDNPFPLLPDVHDPEAAEVFLQSDGSVTNECTCFLFMKPTSMVKQLLGNWMQSIVDTAAVQDQTAFQDPILDAEGAGLRLEHFPWDRFPPGNVFFQFDYEENYGHVYFPNLVVVHNNFIKGHADKLERFQTYHLWDVGDAVFPSCES